MILGNGKSKDKKVAPTVFLPEVKATGRTNKLNILSIKIKKATILSPVNRFVSVDYSRRLPGMAEVS